MRPDAIAPNSPRDSGVGVVMPRAMKPGLGVEIEGEADDVAGHGLIGGNDYNTPRPMVETRAAALTRVH